MIKFKKIKSIDDLLNKVQNTLFKEGIVFNVYDNGDEFYIDVYDSSKKMSDFEIWCAEFDLIAKKNGYVGDSYVNETGKRHWACYFYDGITPIQTWEGDSSYGNS